jgi:small GTP-binding protein
MEKAKFIIVGEGRVGKTSILSQYQNSSFQTEYQSTTAPDKVIKKIKINGQELTLEIWDTAGQEVYKAANKIFMKKSNIALIVYDITERETFTKLNDWYKNVLECANKDGIIFGIAANKSDLYEDKKVNSKEGKEFANSIGALFFETSAKDKESVDLAFNSLAESYLKKLNEKKEEEKEKEENIKIDRESQKKLDLELKEKKGCCGGKKKNNK